MNPKIAVNTSKKKILSFLNFIFYKRSWPQKGNSFSHFSVVDYHYSSLNAIPFSITHKQTNRLPPTVFLPVLLYLILGCISLSTELYEMNFLLPFPLWHCFVIAYSRVRKPFLCVAAKFKIIHPTVVFLLEFRMNSLKSDMSQNTGNERQAIN